MASATVVAEASCVSLLAAAIANSSPKVHVSLPFLAVAVPAVTAVLLSTACGRAARRWWWRAALLVALTVVGAALTAGVVAELTQSGLLWRVATRPWTVSGHQQVATATAAWTVSVLAWVRGVWLGSSRPSFRHTAQSMAIGAAAFAGIVAGRAASHHGEFTRTTEATGWLLFLWFVSATAALAMVRERDLQELVLHHARTRPSSLWLGVLAGPLLAVALVAVLVAVVFGVAAPAIGDAATAAATGVWWLVKTIARALAHLFPHGHPSTTTPLPSSRRGTTPLSTLHVNRPLSHGSPTVWLIVSAVLLVILAYLAIRTLWPLVRPHRQSPQGDLAEDEQRDSLFSWRHLADQLRSALLALLNRFRRRSHAPAALDADRPLRPDHAGGPETVRHAYRRMLAAARTAGSGRASTETTGELRTRLSTGPAAGAGEAVADLTALYDAARYGELEIGETERARASARADTVTAALIPPAAAPADSGGRVSPGDR